MPGCPARPGHRYRFIEGKGHGWYGGRPGAFCYPEAPDISRLVWDFFSRQRLPYRAARHGAMEP